MAEEKNVHIDAGRTGMGFLTFVAIMVVLFVGSPDLHDAIVQWVLGACK